MPELFVQWGVPGVWVFFLRGKFGGGEVYIEGEDADLSVALGGVEG